MIGNLKEAAENSFFQHCWVMADVWAALMNHFYKPLFSLLCSA
jgi:hypothetical protein